MNCDTPTRARTNSNGSMSSDFSDDNRNYRQYEKMTIEEILATPNINTEVFENTRSFNPRKHRSCHKRAEPVSDKRRKEESSRNSREYTKRNREEIRVCRTMYADIFAKKNRIQELVSGLKKEGQENKVLTAIHDFELIMADSLDDGTDIRREFNVPNPEEIFVEYRRNAQKAEEIKFETGIASYEEKYLALREEYEELQNKKDHLMSQKEKTNYASSKSRLKQRMIRAELKTKCYSCWTEIETLKLQGAELKKQSDWLKKTVWENILAIYYNFMKHLRNVKTDLHKVRCIETVVQYFSPFSHVSGELSVKWVPKVEEERPTLLFDMTGQETEELTTSTEECFTPKVQDARISTTSQSSLIPPSLTSPMSTLALPTFLVRDEPKVAPVVNVSSDGVNLNQIWPESEVKKVLEEVKPAVVNNVLAAQNVFEPVLPNRKRSITPEEKKPVKVANQTPSAPPPTIFPRMVPFNFAPNGAPLIMNPAMFPTFPPQFPLPPLFNIGQFLEAWSEMSPQLRQAAEHQKMIQNLLAGAFKK